MLSPLDPAFVCPSRYHHPTRVCASWPLRPHQEPPRDDRYRFLLVITSADAPVQLRHLVSNALAFTTNETLLMLHLDARVDYGALTQGDQLNALKWLRLQPRLEISCVRVPFLVFLNGFRFETKI